MLDTLSLASAVGAAAPPAPSLHAARTSPLPTRREHPPLDRPRRLEYGDPIRVLGTMAVMLGHVADVPLFDAEPNTWQWLLINVLDSGSRWAVPVYVMLSGALLLDPARDESAGQFYRKRLARLGIPIVFWSAFFMLFAIFYTHASTPREALRNLSNGEPYLHLHFIFRLAGLYALTPALRVLVRHASRTLLKQTVLILFVIWAADSLINGIRCIEPSAFACFAPFLGYYLCGYLLRDIRPSRRTRILAMAGFVGSLIVLVAWSSLMARYYDVSPFPSRPMLLHDFLSPVRITMGVCSWILLTHLFRNPMPAQSRFARIVVLLAPLTLGIYLVHPAIRDVLARHGLAAMNFANLVVGVPTVTLMCYILTTITVACAVRVPYVRRLVL